MRDACAWSASPVYVLDPWLAPEVGGDPNPTIAPVAEFFSVPPSWRNAFFTCNPRYSVLVAANDYRLAAIRAIALKTEDKDLIVSKLVDDRALPADDEDVAVIKRLPPEEIIKLHGFDPTSWGQASWASRTPAKVSNGYWAMRAAAGKLILAGKCTSLADGCEMLMRRLGVETEKTESSAKTAANKARWPKPCWSAAENIENTKVGAAIIDVLAGCLKPSTTGG